MSSEINLSPSPLAGEGWREGEKPTTNTDNIAIRVENLSKCYHIYDRPRDRLLQMLARGRRQYYREFWALREVSFEIKKGETVGIIGVNGAGKSTLLQMICGTLNPTSGSIQTNGRVAALLELGSGFNPEFTGRENVFMNCALHGMSHQEVADRFEDIADFAGIGDFIDQPVKFYSSGMFARLAFSAAVHVDPDLLIVDEALSVGDRAFQEKSITRMKEIRERGTCILFVSHSITAVRNFCERALWLDRGQVRAFGARLGVCDEYQNEVEDTIRKGVVSGTMNRCVARTDGLSQDAKVLSIVSVSCDKPSYMMGSDISIDIKLKFNGRPGPYGVGLIIYDRIGNVVSVLNTLRDELVMTDVKEEWRLTIRDNHFAPGEYSVTVSIPDENVMFSYEKWEHCVRFRVEMERNSQGFARVEGVVRCDHDWQ
jgi:ABC-type polysaccharide/polyol phosphate transport system ATPase subunit